MWSPKWTHVFPKSAQLIKITVQPWSRANSNGFHVVCINVTISQISTAENDIYILFQKLQQCVDNKGKLIANSYHVYISMGGKSAKA